MTLKNFDAQDEQKLSVVAQTIAAAMGHPNRWQQYMTVARMSIAGFIACQLLDRDGHRLTTTRTRRKRSSWASKKLLTPENETKPIL
jgi:hypothetical protein